MEGGSSLSLAPFIAEDEGVILPAKVIIFAPGESALHTFHGGSTAPENEDVQLGLTKGVGPNFLSQQCGSIPATENRQAIELSSVDCEEESLC